MNPCSRLPAARIVAPWWATTAGLALGFLAHYVAAQGSAAQGTAVLVSAAGAVDRRLPGWTEDHCCSHAGH